MDNIYLIGLIISFIFFVTKFLEMRFITKENKSLKTIVIDTIFVYFSVIIGHLIVSQFNLQISPKTPAPAFVDSPGF